MKTIQLPIYGIVVEISENKSNASITSDLKTENNDEEDELYNAAIDGLEAMILACACNGIEINSVQFVDAIRISVEAISNNF